MMENFFYVIVITPGTGVDPPGSPDIYYASEGEIVAANLERMFILRGAMHSTAKADVQRWDRQSDIEVQLWDGGWIRVEALPLSEVFGEIAPFFHGEDDSFQPAKGQA